MYKVDNQHMPNYVIAVFCGHNHGNDYVGKFGDLLLCYGRLFVFAYLTVLRHTGYGGYGTWERGARIIELTGMQCILLSATENPWQISTWIRYEDGRREDQGVKHPPIPPYQAECD